MAKVWLERKTVDFLFPEWGAVDSEGRVFDVHEVPRTEFSVTR